MTHTISELCTIKKEYLSKLASIVEDYPKEKMSYDLDRDTRITSIFRDDDGEMKVGCFDKTDKELFLMKVKDMNIQELYNLATHLILTEKREERVINK